MKQPSFPASSFRQCLLLGLGVMQAFSLANAQDPVPSQESGQAESKLEVTPRAGAIVKTPPKAKYKLEFRHSFKGAHEGSKEWETMGAEADECVKFEPTGLRIVLPSGHTGTREDTGVVRGLTVEGDFEITLNFEILKEPAPADAGAEGSRFTLTAALAKTDQNMATISYKWGNKKGNQLVAWYTLFDRGKTQSRAKLHLTSAKSGRLRLVRNGSEVSFHAAATNEDDFVHLNKFPFGPEPLQYVSIAATTGGEKAALDVRATDLRIRAESLPGLPTTAVETAEPMVPAVVDNWKGPKGRPAEFSIGWVLGLTLPGLLCLAGGMYLWRRGRSETLQAAPLPTKSSSVGHNAIAVPCPTCGKHLRARAELAGKRIKCPACGNPVPLPAIATR